MKMVKIKMTQSNSFDVNSDPAKRTRLKKAAGFLGLFCFSAIVIYFSVSENESPTELEDALNRSADSAKSIQDGGCDIHCAILEGCDIECSGGETINLNEILLKLSVNCTTITTLTVSSTKFPGNRLPKMWLSGKFRILHLTIAKSRIEEIENEAFNTTVFHDTIKLYLNNLHVKSFSPRTLLGLYSLKELTLTVDSSMAEFGNFLAPVQRTLESFKFIYQSRQLPVQAIFGDVIMHSLKIVDLRYNDFGDTLNETAFDALPSVQSLYLSSSKINTIPEGTFSGSLRSLDLLDLNYNPLTYLSPNVFEGLLGRTRFSVELSYIELICDSKLLPFAEEYEKYRTNFKEMVICSCPEKLRGCELNSSLIRDGSNCSRHTSTTTPSITEEPTREPTSASTGKQTTGQPTTITSPNTTPSGTENPGTETTSATTDMPSTITTPITKDPCIEPTTTSTTPTTTESNGSNNGENKVVNYECKCCITQNCDVGKSYPIEYVQMGKQKVQFILQVISPSAVRLSGLLNYARYTIVWTSQSGVMRVSNDFGCISPFERQEIRIEGLAPDTTYTFCLVKDTAYWISPLDCQSVHVPPEVFDVSWIGESSREFCIAMLVVGVVCSILFGCLCTYCVIRCKTCLAARKKMSLQYNFPAKPKKKPRKRTGSDETIPVGSCRSFTFHGPGVHQKISTISNGSGISYVVPNTYEVIKPDRKFYSSQETAFIDTIPSNSPPPLPKRTYTMICQRKKDRPTKPRADSYA